MLQQLGTIACGNCTKGLKDCKQIAKEHPNAPKCECICHKKCSCGFNEDTSREIGHFKACAKYGEKTWWQDEEMNKKIKEIGEIESIFFADGRHNKECPTCGVSSISHQHLKGKKPNEYVELPDNVMHLSETKPEVSNEDYTMFVKNGRMCGFTDEQLDFLMDWLEYFNNKKHG